jgi:23S rRNA (cytidine1920-2'-O)/16S rRNA (cytidine1409-2'-O)-methyltransferase
MQVRHMRQRLDQVLVARGLVQSRARAADLIRRGAVRIAGEVAAKAGLLVDQDAAIAIEQAANAYVARSGAKLAAALAAFGFDARDRIALDIGASTGGFTQVLLAAGAARVHAVDVGHDQLHESLRDDPRVVSLEGLDARQLTRQEIAGDVSAIVADVSFVSLRQVLPAPLRLAASDCWLVALVKPQFEVGRAAIGKRGVVRDSAVQRQAVEDVVGFLHIEGWRVVGQMQSPLPGKEGNIEWLVGAVTGGAGVR